jgi:2-haloacid dehalogenase
MAKAALVRNFFGKNYFKYVIGEETLKHLKDDSTYYKEALEKLSWKSEQVISIGDSIKTDIFPAKLVGIKTIWINRKTGSQHLEIDSAPDFMATDLKSAIKYLNNCD